MAENKAVRIWLPEFKTVPIPERKSQAPRWTIAGMGLNVQGLCSDAECPSRAHTTRPCAIYPAGTKFCLFSDKPICRACSRVLEPRSAFLIGCDVSLTANFSDWDEAMTVGPWTCPAGEYKFLDIGNVSGCVQLDFEVSATAAAEVGADVADLGAADSVGLVEQPTRTVEERKAQAVETVTRCVGEAEVETKATRELVQTSQAKLAEVRQKRKEKDTKLAKSTVDSQAALKDVQLQKEAVAGMETSVRAAQTAAEQDTAADAIQAKLDEVNATIERNTQQLAQLQADRKEVEQQHQQLLTQASKNEAKMTFLRSVLSKFEKVRTVVRSLFAQMFPGFTGKESLKALIMRNSNKDLSTDAQGKATVEMNQGISSVKNALLELSTTNTDVATVQADLLALMQSYEQQEASFANATTMAREVVQKLEDLEELLLRKVAEEEAKQAVSSAPVGEVKSTGLNTVKNRLAEARRKRGGTQS